MSIIIGVRRPLGPEVGEQELLQLAARTSRYAPDGTSVYAHGRTGMVFQSYHTTERSHLEIQPASDAQGNVLAFDGRLDNHEYLSAQLGSGGVLVSDSSLVLASFQHWGEQCFRRFVGDWAIALWSVKDHTLYLARDHAGARTLYFQNVNGVLRWSTYLESFFAAGERVPLNEGYAARYLCGEPIRHLTPYQGIQAVAPAHYLAIRDGMIANKAHWEPPMGKEIRYGSDAEYEEHFFGLFKESVDRRTDAGTNILAQLSGGMDSTSIVCMSDYMRRSQGAEPGDLLDTISYFDDSEPNWNERPYFTVTEVKRGKTGIHVDAGFLGAHTFAPPGTSEKQYLLPPVHGSELEHEKRIEIETANRDYRAVLSGIGGDELLGGVSTPMPELASHLIAGDLLRFLRRSIEWCRYQRTPLIKMLYGAAKFTLQQHSPVGNLDTQIPRWISQQFSENYGLTEIAARGEVRGTRIRAATVNNSKIWGAIMETLPHCHPGLLKRYEYRYPYLDRNLVEFLFCVPREQLVSPGRRRALMRRALRDIVPSEILERRRKAYLTRGPLIALQNAGEQIDTYFVDSVLAKNGFIDIRGFQRSMASIASGTKTAEWPFVMRTILFDQWLKANPFLSYSRPSLAAQASKSTPASLQATKLRGGQSPTLFGSTEIRTNEGNTA
jgi:asparagine synthase (glutamine-hydrolysing)